MWTTYPRNNKWINACNFLLVSNTKNRCVLCYQVRHSKLHHLHYLSLTNIASSSHSWQICTLASEIFYSSKHNFTAQDKRDKKDSRHKEWKPKRKGYSYLMIRKWKAKDTTLSEWHVGCEQGGKWIASQSAKDGKQSRKRDSPANMP